MRGEMMKWFVPMTALFVALSAAAAARGADVRSEAPPRPNVLLLVADDLGWADVSFNGGGGGEAPIKTPNIDRIAASGVKLAQFYVQPLCSPTRAALMTGRYPMRY